MPSLLLSSSLFMLCAICVSHSKIILSPDDKSYEYVDSKFYDDDDDEDNSGNEASGSTAIPFAAHETLEERPSSAGPILDLVTEKFAFLGAVSKATLKQVIANADDDEKRKAAEIISRLCRTQQCEVLPPFETLPYGIRYVTRRRLAACTIPENYPNLVSATFCYLSNASAFETAFDFETKTVRPRCGTTKKNQSRLAVSLCSDVFASSWGTVRSGAPAAFADTHKLVLARDPMERFLHSFEINCIKRNKCAGCKTIECVLERLQEYAREFSAHDETLQAYEDPMRFVLFHFAPQSWRCDMFERRFQYEIVKADIPDADDFGASLADFLMRGRTTAAEVEFVRSQILESVVSKPLESEAHRTTLLSSTSLMQKFMSVFFFDYLVFEYPLPEPSALFGK